MNKIRKFLCYGVASLSMSAASAAEPIRVSSVAELTNAVFTAKAGDTIILLKSGSPYVFNDEFMLVDAVANKDGSTTPVTNFLAVAVNNLTISGEDETSLTSWTDHAEPVIIDGNGKGRILFVENNITGTQIKNLTFTGGNPGQTSQSIGGAAYVKKQNMAHLVMSNCVFRQNFAYEYAAAGYATLYDCVVTNCICFSKNAFRGTAYRTDFIDNRPAVCEKSYLYDCRFVGNHRDGGGACGSSVYVISNCYAEANTGGYCFDLSGVNVKVQDCVFTNNAVDNAVLLNPQFVKGCTLTDNRCATARSGCGISYNKTCEALIDDCRFVRNISTGSSSCGGAILMQRTVQNAISVTVSNCFFSGNGAIENGGAICNDINNLPSSETAWDYFKVYDSTFEGNTAKNAAGVSGVHAIRCTFKGNFRTDIEKSLNYLGCDASSSYLERCDISSGELANCVVVGSVLHDITNTVNCVFREYTRVTNSIIRNCWLNEYERSMYLARKTLDAEFVNCTFVTNSMFTYSVFADITITNAVKFINCLFSGNRNKTLESDITALERGGWELWRKFEFQDTYYGTFSSSNYLTDEMFATKTSIAGALSQCPNPKFAGQYPSVMRRYPNEPYWALSYRSPLIGKGHVWEGAENAVDIDNRKRIRCGKIDVGCYQCWMDPPGTVISVR